MYRLPSTRKEALKTETIRYYTGELCERGHRASRYTHNGMCEECSNYEISKKYSR